MDRFTNNPGLQHVAENIFLLLDPKTLGSCQLVNRSWKNILENPRFWLKKSAQIGMPRELYSAWYEYIKILEDPCLQQKAAMNLFKMCKNKVEPQS